MRPSLVAAGLRETLLDRLRLQSDRLLVTATGRLSALREPRGRA